MIHKVSTPETNRTAVQLAGSIVGSANARR
jgi:hypothetical protein